MGTQRVDIADATKSLAEYAKQVEGGDGPVVVTAGGRPVAAVIPIGDEDDLESISLGTNPKFIEIIQRSRERYAREGGISYDEMRRRLGLS